MSKCNGTTSCEAMSRSLNDPDARSGISTKIIMNTRGDLIECLNVLYSGEFKKRGIAISRCPFCGFIFRRKKRKAKSDA
jgi:hypothetical protein